MLGFLAIVLVAVLVTAVAVVVVSLKRSGPQAAPAPVQSGTAEPVPVEEVEETATEKPPTDSDSRMLQDGWQRAASAKWGFVYEIPPREDGWKFDSPTMIRGFENDEGEATVGMSGTSVYREDACPNWGSRALLGAQGITDSDDTEDMAEAVAFNWALHAYDDNGAPGRSVRSVEEFSANGLTGHHAIVDVTVPGGDDCVPSTAIVHAVAVPGREDDGSSRIFLMLLDSGVDDAVSEEIADTIVSTLRDVDYEI